MNGSTPRGRRLDRVTERSDTRTIDAPQRHQLTARERHRDIDVAVITVTYNSARHIPGFVGALAGGMDGAGRWRLTVADNDSADSTIASLAELAPDARVIRMGGNRGYAAGINAALAATPASAAALILNPDARLCPRAAQRLLNALTTPSVGIAVPRLLSGDGHVQHSLRREPTVLRAMGEAIVGGRAAGRFERFGEVVTDDASYDRPGVADWATGAAWLISAECRARVGPWDESFFLYSEETDFALRARDEGYLLQYVPDAECVHDGGESTTSPSLWSLLAVNRVRLFARRHGAVQSAAFWAAVTANEAIRAATGRATHRAALRALLAMAAPANLRRAA